MDNEINNKEYIIARVCEFLNLEKPELTSSTIKETIKELCVAKLCKIVGITCKYNYKSDFFEFFSNLMGEAVCDKLRLKMHIAEDNLRLFKYEHINLIETTRSYLENDDIEETVLDAFNLADKFKYLIPKLKRV